MKVYTQVLKRFASSCCRNYWGKQHMHNLWISQQTSFRNSEKWQMCLFRDDPNQCSLTADFCVASTKRAMPTWRRNTYFFYELKN